MVNYYSLEAGFTGARNRSRFITPQSGMCSFCTEECSGTCELALAAVLGKQTVYPMTTGNNQIGGEKNYYLDWSHFNINGHCIGAKGCNADFNEAEIYNVDLKCKYGKKNPVKMEMPIILPALIKLNWEDYFGGAAMAGVSCVIGEDAKSKYPDLVINNGKITEFPFIGRVLDSFNRYYRGYGQIFLQCNVEDDMMGVAEIASKKYGAKAIEYKFGQSAKGTQPALRLKGYEDAKKAKEAGYLVHPDPDDAEITVKYENGTEPNFYKYLRLPQWETGYLKDKFETLRGMGVENIAFKMACYDPEDIETVIRMSIDCDVDMITFDAAGGGSGYSPCHMMSEWGLPVVTMQQKINSICKRLRNEGNELPAIVITGGFSSEDQVFKSLAFGGENTFAIGICRAAMAAAMVGKNIEKQIEGKEVNPLFSKYGTTKEEIFADLPDLRSLYGKDANNFSAGAIGVYSYLRKIGFGLQHFSALARKFDIKLLRQEDLIPLTEGARRLIDD